MSQVVKFICGCAHVVPSKKEDLTDPLMLDQEGFVICAPHRTRRYGWRDASHKNPVDYRGVVRPGWTDYETEQYEVWGIMPDPAIVEIDSNGQVDRRERRDFITPLEKMVQKGDSRPGSARRIANRIQKQPQPES